MSFEKSRKRGPVETGRKMIPVFATMIGGEQMRAFLLAMGAVVVLVLVSLTLVDVPVARFVHTLPWAQNLRSPALGLPVLVTLSGVAIFCGALLVANGHVPHKLQEILIVASFSLTSSVCIDELLLKRFFGRETPDEFLQGGVDAFNWFQGTPNTAFPSGHAVQIVSVGTVFLLAYPRQRAAWLTLMGVGLIALVLGNWHFVSDVVAGTGVGASAGIATTVLWRAKSRSGTTAIAERISPDMMTPAKSLTREPQ
jgi:membrane-associated phospholipid phosphatase